MPWRIGKGAKVYKVKGKTKSRRKTYKTKGAAKRACGKTRCTGKPHKRRRTRRRRTRSSGWPW